MLKCLLIPFTFFSFFLCVAQRPDQELFKMGIKEFYIYVNSLSDNPNVLHALLVYSPKVQKDFSEYSKEYAQIEKEILQFLYYKKDARGGINQFRKIKYLIDRIYGRNSYESGEIRCYVADLFKIQNIPDSCLYYAEESNSILIKNIASLNVANLLFYNHANIFNFSNNNELLRKRQYLQAKKVIKYFEENNLYDDNYCKILETQASYEAQSENNVSLYKKLYEVGMKIYKNGSKEYFSILQSYIEDYLTYKGDRKEFEKKIHELINFDLKSKSILTEDYCNRSISVITNIRKIFLDPSGERYFLSKLDSVIEANRGDNSYYFCKALIEFAIEENYCFQFGILYELSYLRNSIKYLSLDHGSQDRKAIRLNGSRIYTKYADYFEWSGKGILDKKKIDSAEIYYLKAIKEDGNIIPNISLKSYANYLFENMRFADALSISNRIIQEDSLYWGKNSVAYASSLSFLAEVYAKLKKFKLADYFFEKAITIANSKNTDYFVGSSYYEYANYLFIKGEFDKGFFYFNKYLKSFPDEVMANNRGGSTLVEQNKTFDNTRNKLLYYLKVSGSKMNTEANDELLNFIIVKSAMWLYREKKLLHYTYLFQNDSVRLPTDVKYRPFLFNTLINSTYENWTKINKDSSQKVLDSLGFRLDELQAEMNNYIEANYKHTKFITTKDIQNKLTNNDIFIKACSGSDFEKGNAIKGTEFKCLIIIKKDVPNPVFIFDKTSNDIIIKEENGISTLILSKYIQDILGKYVKDVTNIYFKPENKFSNINLLNVEVNDKLLINNYTSTIVDDVQSFVEDDESQSNSIKNILIIANPNFIIRKLQADSIFSSAFSEFIQKGLHDSSFQKSLGLENNFISNIFDSGFNNKSIDRISPYPIANARSGTQYLSPLPYTAIEADSITQIAKLQKLDVILKEGIDANEDEVKSQMPFYDIIHISTHGFYKGDAFNFNIWKGEYLPYFKTGICLTGAQNTLNLGIPFHKMLDNGIMNGFEIKNLNLQKCKLAVLSSCETGLGDMVQAESNYSLQRAFSIAGVKSILFTLWRVGDKATQILMREFYRNWLALKMSKSKALQQAQLYLKALPGYDNPKFWAPFVLTGK